MTRNYVGIGVRELKAKEILSNVVDPEVSVVLDPTMMLEKQVWDELAIMPMIAEKYILIYKIGSVTNIVETVYKACKQAGYMVISIGYAQNTYNDNEEKISDITISSAGPREWIGWIKNAEYVFTDSFHGSAFSIIFNKDFWCFEKNKSSSTNENSRLYSLMQIFGLEDRLLSEDSMIAALLFEKKINYAEVMHTYGVEKKFSLDYINACLETIGKRVKSGYE